MRIYYGFIALLVGSFILSGCYQDPNYPSVPLITYQSIEVSEGDIADTVRVTIQIQDKEGDLGLQNNELTNPIFQTANNDDEGHQFFYNFFIEVFRKTGNDYKEIIFPDGQELHGRFPRFLVEEGNNTMEVTLTYEFPVFFVFGSPIKEGDTLQFSVQIADRALNLSNIVFTDDVTL